MCCAALIVKGGSLRCLQFSYYSKNSKCGVVFRVFYFATRKLRIWFFRFSDEYLVGVGNVVNRICGLVPQGVLVFFASYMLMHLCVKRWKVI